MPNQRPARHRPQSRAACLRATPTPPRTGGIRDAKTRLRCLSERKRPPYNLARFCWALVQIQEAREWLGKALEIGGKALKSQALDDEELEAVC